MDVSLSEHRTRSVRTAKILNKNYPEGGVVTKAEITRLISFNLTGVPEVIDEYFKLMKLWGFIEVNGDTVKIEKIVLTP